MSENGPRPVVQPEIKSVMLLKNIMCKFFEPAQVVLDPFPKTISTAKQCLLLYKHSRLLGCDKDGSCLQKSVPSLSEDHASPLLNNRSGFTGDEQLTDSVRVYLAAVKSGR